MNLLTMLTLKKKVEDDFANSNIMKLETTMGTIKIKLFPDKAPKTVQHIKALVNKKFLRWYNFPQSN